MCVFFHSFASFGIDCQIVRHLFKNSAKGKRFCFTSILMPEKLSINKIEKKLRKKQNGQIETKVMKNIGHCINAYDDAISKKTNKLIAYISKNKDMLYLCFDCLHKYSTKQKYKLCVNLKCMNFFGFAHSDWCSRRQKEEKKFKQKPKYKIQAKVDSKNLHSSESNCLGAIIQFVVQQPIIQER